MANLRADNITGTGGRNAIDGSLFFNGDSDGLAIPSIALGSGDWTIEFWFYMTKTSSNNQHIYDGRGTGSASSAYPIIRIDTNEKLSYYTTGAGRITGNTTIQVGSWNHVAFVKNSGTLTAYLNGVSEGTYSDSNTYIAPSNSIGRIGSDDNGSGYFFYGYLSNFRFVTGTAVYTAAFTPPTQKLTAVENTVLLCCQDSNDALQEATGKTITGFGRYEYLSGTNLVTNGSGNSVSGWTDSNTSTFASTNGRIQVTRSGGSGNCSYQAITTIAGQQYTIRANIEKGSGSYADIRVYTDSGFGTFLAILRSDASTSGLRETTFTATTTTTHITFVIDTNGETGYYSDISVIAANPGKAPRVLPPYGIDEGVAFDGGIKKNTQGYMYFPTGDTTQRGRGRGVISQGMNPSSVLVKTLQYIEIQSMGNTVDFGDNTDESYGATAVSSSTRGITALGATSNSSPYAIVNTLDYITIATTANATDFGDLVVAAMNRTGMSNNTRGVFAAGFNPNTRVMDLITIASTGDATDFGDSIGGRYGMNQGGQAGSSTRGLLAGGDSNSAPFEVNKIQYITFASAADSQDFGDLNDNNGYFNIGASSDTRAVFAGGDDLDSPYPTTDRIDYVTIATLGNATDFGNLSVSRYIGYGMSNGIRGVFAGGVTIPGPTVQNTIDYVTIATTGNANDFGDMTEPVRSGGGISDSHGGIS